MTLTSNVVPPMSAAMMFGVTGRRRRRAREAMTPPTGPGLERHHRDG